MRLARSPICLIIMDGLAYSGPPRHEAGQGDRLDDAVSVARTPVIDGLWSDALHATLTASGEDVGLPAGQMGNSEVGHLNIGAGHTVLQELSRIDRAIDDESFFENDVLRDALISARDSGATLHLMGLVSDGGVHSSLDHLTALLRLAKRLGVADVAVHAILDGRDTAPTSGKRYLSQVADTCEHIGVGRIASIMGRYWAMDRDKRWERVASAYDALTSGAGASAASWREAIQASYDASVTDEFVEPIRIDGAFTPISDGDSVIFFNFRPDRARELTRAFVDDDFSGFTRQVHPHTHFVCLATYDDTIDAPVAFEKEILSSTLGEVVSRSGLRQYRIAETEKYAHVTFFFSGGREEPFSGEQRVLIASPKIATYDLKPEMSAIEVTDTLVGAIEADTADLYIVNFANGDMVGHTGMFDATVQAVEVVDSQIGRIVEAMAAKSGVTVITADHGNAEQMRDAYDGTPFTAHTSNDVPLIVVGSSAQAVKNGALRDITPTVASLLGIEADPLWTGTDLLVY